MKMEGPRSSWSRIYEGKFERKKNFVLRSSDSSTCLLRSLEAEAARPKGRNETARHAHTRLQDT